MAKTRPGPPKKIDIPRMLGEAYRAFKRLQEWGCGEDLGALVLFIHLDSLPSKIRGEGRRLHFRRADSHELLLNGICLRDARTQIKHARAALDKFRKALEPLEGARIWQQTDFILCYKDQALQLLEKPRSKRRPMRS